ncbi:hypothetical protein [Archaeoglobus fulgidus]|jgi:hypothetical protein|uniref:Uncharacterized protein AF_0453 n=2 Tax=Archaeoglobus fulgidus TaxID=2234 RepID=Y453_ARCFU|nr:hypothetical protein [Archaeoglobus fulgidus]O29796.1 RecName: Full=Uncharacterized protein AF_0453 [Archaeoglobus fulgidus DSM 4304]AAB90788.1 predicted coding region AF_0453 [Archaeoglobus fulgidus DSM 4304]
MMDAARKILERLEKRGYKIIEREKVRGESGIEHTFDAVILGPQGKRIAVTILERLGFEHVIPLLAFRNDHRMPHIVFAKEIEVGVEKILKNSNIVVIHLKDLSVAYDHPELREEQVLEKVLKLLEDTT